MALPELPLHFAVAGEDEAHHFVVTTLTDRVLAQHITWLGDVIESCRIWCASSDSRPWSLFTRARKQVRARDLRSSLPTGHFGRGEPGQLDARFARAQLHLWKDARCSLPRGEPRPGRGRFGSDPAEDHCGTIFAQQPVWQNSPPTQSVSSMHDTPFMQLGVSLHSTGRSSIV